MPWDREEEATYTHTDRTAAWASLLFSKLASFQPLATFLRTNPDPQNYSGGQLWLVRGEGSAQPQELHRVWGQKNIQRSAPLSARAAQLSQGQSYGPLVGQQRRSTPDSVVLLSLYAHYKLVCRIEIDIQPWRSGARLGFFGYAVAVGRILSPEVAVEHPAVSRNAIAGGDIGGPKVSLTVALRCRSLQATCAKEFQPRLHRTMNPAARQMEARELFVPIPP